MDLIKFETSNGLKADSIELGNRYNKYNTRNPIAQKLQANFETSLIHLIKSSSPKKVYEIGCGEGFWTIKLNTLGIPTRGCDISPSILELAKFNTKNTFGHDKNLFDLCNIYDITANLTHKADLIMCCEVLEHIHDPHLALQILKSLGANYYIFSVPREPLWCFMNMCRGKYLKSLGNTPGHIQHWGKNKFIKLISNYFEIDLIKTPTPWTMLLCK